MPQSLVINLITQSSAPASSLQGHALQQLFFSLVEAVDPKLGRVLRHDKRNRSYSLSALQVHDFADEAIDEAIAGPAKLRVLHTRSHEPYQVQSAIASGALQYSHPRAIASETECWWRISFLDDALFDHLIFLWNQLCNETFPLGAGSVKIVRLVSELPGLNWVASCSYRDIYEQASAYEQDIHLQFVTPTAFETKGCITPLPTADAVFQPLRKYWNCYSGLVFAPSLVSNIVPIDFDIKTQSVQNKLKKSLQTITGCTGKISFRIGGQGDPLINKRINALADFTQYCPIGLNTQFGMGVVKRSRKLRGKARQTQTS